MEIDDFERATSTDFANRYGNEIEDVNFIVMNDTEDNRARHFTRTAELVTHYNSFLNDEVAEALEIKFDIPKRVTNAFKMMLSSYSRMSNSTYRDQKLATENQLVRDVNEPNNTYMRLDLLSTLMSAEEDNAYQYKFKIYQSLNVMKYRQGFPCLHRSIIANGTPKVFAIHDLNMTIIKTAPMNLARQTLTKVTPPHQPLGYLTYVEDGICTVTLNYQMIMGNTMGVITSTLLDVVKIEMRLPTLSEFPSIKEGITGDVVKFSNCRMDRLTHLDRTVIGGDARTATRHYGDIVITCMTPKALHKKVTLDGEAGGLVQIPIRSLGVVSSITTMLAKAQSLVRGGRNAANMRLTMFDKVGKTTPYVFQRHRHGKMKIRNTFEDATSKYAGGEYKDMARFEVLCLFVLVQLLSSKVPEPLARQFVEEPQGEIFKINDVLVLNALQSMYRADYVVMNTMSSLRYMISVIQNFSNFGLSHPPLV